MNDPSAIPRIEMTLPDVHLRNYPNEYVEINRGTGVGGHGTISVSNLVGDTRGRNNYAVAGRIDGTLTYKSTIWLFYGHNVQYGLNGHREHDRLGGLHFRDQETEGSAPTPTVQKALVALIEQPTLALLPSLFTFKNGRLAAYLDALSQVHSKLGEVRRALTDAQKAFDQYAAESEPHG